MQSRSIWEKDEKDSMFYDQVKPGDEVLADKAFHMNEYLLLHYFPFAMAPAVKKKSQITTILERWKQQQGLTTQKTAHSRLKNTYTHTYTHTNTHTHIFSIYKQIIPTKIHHCLAALLVHQILPDICINPLRVMWRGITLHPDGLIVASYF